MSLHAVPKTVEMANLLTSHFADGGSTRTGSIELVVGGLMNIKNSYT